MMANIIKAGLNNFFRFTAVAFLFFSCVKDKGRADLTASGFPQEVSEIITNKCATSGCHNDLNKQAVGGISFETWSSLFSGTKSGLCVIPYRPDYSTFCFFTNTDPNKGPVTAPTMPLNSSPLSETEYLLLKKWIAEGASDVKGSVKFSDNTKRKKIYVVNYTCDVVTVFDSETLLPMRYVDVGVPGTDEFPYQLKVSPDNNFWLVSFFSPSTKIQKFDAANDKLIGELDLGPGNWSTCEISSDSKKAWFADNSSPGKIAYTDIESMSVTAVYTFSDALTFPRGLQLCESLNKLFVGNEAGNFIYDITITDPLSPTLTTKAIDGNSVVATNNSIDPILFAKTSDDNLLFASGEYATSVRMLDAATSSLIATFTLPSSPRQIDIYEPMNLLFVTCPDDVTSFPTTVGSVIVIDYVNKVVVKKIFTGYQPYGIAIDRKKKVAAVCNANLYSGGPTPHHQTGCAGRNGYITFIDLDLLTVLDKKIETAVFPRFAAVRN